MDEIQSIIKTHRYSCAAVSKTTTRLLCRRFKSFLFLFESSNLVQVAVSLFFKLGDRGLMARGPIQKT